MQYPSQTSAPPPLVRPPRRPLWPPNTPPWPPRPRGAQTAPTMGNNYPWQTHSPPKPEPTITTTITTTTTRASRAPGALGPGGALPWAQVRPSAGLWWGPPLVTGRVANWTGWHAGWLAGWLAAWLSSWLASSHGWAGNCNINKKVIFFKTKNHICIHP